ncbi:unnamed protein product [Cunninghamella echinulata]
MSFIQNDTELLYLREHYTKHTNCKNMLSSLANNNQHKQEDLEDHEEVLPWNLKHWFNKVHFHEDDNLQQHLKDDKLNRLIC